MKQRIFIMTTNGKLYADADVKGGLAVHGPWCYIGQTFRKPFLGYSEWQITHVTSGYKLPRAMFNSRKAAESARKRLIPLIDWEKVLSADDVPTDVRIKIREIMP